MFLLGDYSPRAARPRDPQQLLRMPGLILTGAHLLGSQLAESRAHRGEGLLDELLARCTHSGARHNVQAARARRPSALAPGARLTEIVKLVAFLIAEREMFGPVS